MMARLLSLFAFVLLTPTLALAQPLGVFRWQLQPYCNVVAVAVTASGNVFELEGTDDQCGGGAASASGTAFVNPDGSIGFGLTIVAAPSGTPVHVDASISLTTLSGTWRDSTGASGSFLFTPGAGTGGDPRPAGFGFNFPFLKSVLLLNTPAGGSIGVGDDALGNSGANATENTALGSKALENLTTGIANTAVGTNALRVNTTGESNVAVGFNALAQGGSGSSNVAVGAFALSRSIGDDNVAVGLGALAFQTAGNRNIAIGSGAGRGSGSNNIMIGTSAGSFLSDDSTASNNIYIGSVGASGDNNTIRIGDRNLHLGTLITGIANRTSAGGVPVLINADGRLGTSTSSARFKAEIAPLEADARRVHDLKPVRFVYKPEYDDGSRHVQFGLIAEEVAASFPDLLVRDEDWQPWTVRYHLLTPLLLAEVQRLERERATQVDELQALREELRALRESFRQLEAKPRSR